MKPVDQIVEGPHGDCFRACLASLFELPVTAVPNFYDIDASDEGWWKAVRDWLRPYGLGIMWLELRSVEHLKLFEGFLIVSGLSKRGLHHATIWKDGALVHDPHPQKCGLDTVEGVDMLYPLDPSILVRYGLEPTK